MTNEIKCCRTCKNENGTKICNLDEPVYSEYHVCGLWEQKEEKMNSIIFGIGCFLGIIFYKHLKTEYKKCFENSIPKYFFEKTKRERPNNKRTRRL